MCTAMAYRGRHFFFGRTMDYERSYGESVVITPRNFSLGFYQAPSEKPTYALIGMAHVENKIPLYYDAVNECGLGMAGLRFAGNAVYHAPQVGKESIASFEMIPRILRRCATVADARRLLKRVLITDAAFCDALPPSPLHWLIADRREAIVVEQQSDGLHIHDNPVGVLTNNPPFTEQQFRLRDYVGLSPRDPINTFSDEIELPLYSRGMGALGLPGDWSSVSRFVRASFVKLNSVLPESIEDVTQCFHVLGSVEQVCGCCAVGENYEMTVYTACCDADTGTYYYTTYGNHRITAVDLHGEDLQGDKPVVYPLTNGEQIRYLNRNES